MERAQETRETKLNAKARELEATHAQKKELERELRRGRTEAEKELSRLRSELKGKCEELKERNVENQTLKDRDTERRNRVILLRQERNNLLQVETFHLFIT